MGHLWYCYIYTVTHTPHPTRWFEVKRSTNRTEKQPWSCYQYQTTLQDAQALNHSMKKEPCSCYPSQTMQAKKNLWRWVCTNLWRWNAYEFIEINCVRIYCTELHTKLWRWYAHKFMDMRCAKINGDEMGKNIWRRIKKKKMEMNGKE